MRCIYQGYHGSLAIALLVMIINLVYTITLDKFREIKILTWLLDNL